MHCQTIFTGSRIWSSKQHEITLVKFATHQTIPAEFIVRSVNLLRSRFMYSLKYVLYLFKITIFIFKIIFQCSKYYLL